MIRITEEKQLLQQLQIAFPEISRTRLKQYLQNGRVLVNGKSVTQFDHMLHPGDTIDIGQSQPRALFPQNSGIRLVYEDRHLVVIDKQEGILSMATSHHSLC
ncbi:MAG: RNA pseudouridine synthase, partial [Bacteroidaceae bacterium]|nr:RNA pseudouridine synthase [Bacteroidaceae bacterium]